MLTSGLRPLRAIRCCKVDRLGHCGKYVCGKRRVKMQRVLYNEDRKLQLVDRAGHLVFISCALDQRVYTTPTPYRGCAKTFVPHRHNQVRDHYHTIPRSYAH